MWVLLCFELNSRKKLILSFRVLEGLLLSNHHISYLHGGVVAALLHVQQRSALPASPELHLQPAGTNGLRGCPLQGLSQQDIAFGTLLQGVVQAARAIQGQGGVHTHVYGGGDSRQSALVSQAIVKCIFPLWCWCVFGTK